MATAPKPGSADKEAAERLAIKIAQGGEEYVLYAADLGPHDDILSRKQTGMPVTSFFEDESFGADSLLILYWVARRKAGEKSLKFATVLQQFPTYEAIRDAEFDLEVIEEGEGDDQDPLPSGED